MSIVVLCLLDFAMKTWSAFAARTGCSSYMEGIVLSKRFDFGSQEIFLGGAESDWIFEHSG